MNPWQVLGVEPGSDRKAIKRAYSQRVKAVNPEDHPEAFMQLRQAYERVMKTLETPARPMVFAVEEAAEPAAQEAFGWSEPAEGAGKHSGNDSGKNCGQESGGDSGDDSEENSREESPHADQKAPVIDDAWSETPPEPEPRGAPVIDTWTAPPQDADDEPPVDHDDDLTPPRVEDGFQDRQEQLNRLVSAMLRLLDNPDLRNDLARWETLLMAPELHDFQASSAVSSWLLPQVIRVLQSGQAECPFEPAVLIRLDDRFQWSSDQSGTMPVIDDQLLRLSLLIEEARNSNSYAAAKMGWNWLAAVMFSPRGRISRLEFIIGLSFMVGAVTLLLLSSSSLTGAVFSHSLLLIGISTIIMAIKRIRDTGIHLALAFVVGIVFPASWLYFLLASPKHNPKLNDPRLKYSDPVERAYREYYLVAGKRSLKMLLRERIGGIRLDIYLVVTGLWVGIVLLLAF